MTTSDLFDHPVVLFDLDGTISDNSAGILACLEHALAEMGHPVPDAATLRATIGPPLRDAFAHCGVPEAQLDEAVERYRARYHDTGWSENDPYPGVIELIGRLSASGRRVATATSKPEFSATMILDHFGVSPHLEAIGAASLDASRTSKEAVVRHALDLLGADAGEALIVGDRHHDVLGARAAGVATSIGVRWGFAEPGELETAGATAIAADADHLARLLGVSSQL